MVTSGYVSILHERLPAREVLAGGEGEQERTTRGTTEDERMKERTRGKRRYVTLTLSGLT